MTHVITAQAIGEPTEALLGEGIAVCLDHSGRDHHAEAARLLEQGKLLPLTQILGDSWFKQEAAVAYTESGSLPASSLRNVAWSASRSSTVPRICRQTWNKAANSTCRNSNEHGWFSSRHANTRFGQARMPPLAATRRHTVSAQVCRSSMISAAEKRCLTQPCA